MDVRGVSTPWKLLAGFCAATLALAGCDDDPKQEVVDPSTKPDGGGGISTDIDGGGGNGDDNSGPTEMPVAMLGDNVAGKACTSTAECEGENTTCASMIGGISIIGMTIGSQTAEGGYCTGACQDDSSCGAGGVCVGAFNVMGFATQGTCQKSCSSDSDCRTGEGYACSDNNVDLPEGGIPGPDGGMGGGPGGPGGPGGMLPPQPSTCLPVAETADLEDGVAGKACTADGDCPGGTCTTMLMQGGGFPGAPGGMTVTFPGGYCGGKCLKDDQCGKGGVCVGAFSGFGIMNPGNCFQGCKAQADCTRTDGYACLPTRGITGPGPNACQPGMAPTPPSTGDAGMPATN